MICTIRINSTIKANENLFVHEFYLLMYFALFWPIPLIFMHSVSQAAIMFNPFILESSSRNFRLDQ